MLMFEDVNPIVHNFFLNIVSKDSGLVNENSSNDFSRRSATLCHAW